jgi:hypothetical protein
MADQELTYEEALRGLSELFGSDDPAPNRRRRRYLLDLKMASWFFVLNALHHLSAMKSV